MSRKEFFSPTHLHPWSVFLWSSSFSSSSGLLSSSSSSPPVSSPSVTPGGATTNSSPMKDGSSPAAPQPRPVRRAPQGPQALMPLPCKKAESLQYNNFKCPECQTQFSGKAELVTHFQQIRGAPNSVSPGRGQNATPCHAAAACCAKLVFLSRRARSAPLP